MHGIYTYFGHPQQHSPSTYFHSQTPLHPRESREFHMLLGPAASRYRTELRPKRMSYPRAGTRRVLQLSSPTMIHLTTYL